MRAADVEGDVPRHAGGGDRDAENELGVRTRRDRRGGRIVTPAPHDGAREAALLAFWNAVNYFADSHPRIVIGNEMRVRAVEAVDSTLSALIAERVEAAV